MKLRLVDDEGHEYKVGDWVALEDHKVEIEAIHPPRELGEFGTVQFRNYVLPTFAHKVGLRFERIETTA